MNERAPDPTADDFLAHSAWVRTLARHLLEDVADADDVVQDAWVVFSRQPRGGVRNVRGWLRGVVHHLALQRHERTARRREVVADLDELAPSPALVRESEDARRIVVEAVLGLDDPYRSTLLLRYYQDLSAEDIARRLGIPSSTVRNRLQRGLRQVRQRLGDRDPRHGPDLAGLLITVAGPASASSPTLIGNLLMASALAKVCVCAVAAGLIVLAVQMGSEEPKSKESVASLTDNSASEALPANESGQTNKLSATPESIEHRQPSQPIPNAPPAISGLHGSIVVVDESGVEHPKESGTLELSIWNDKRGVPTQTQVIDGQWSLPLDRADKLSVEGALLGGRWAYDPLHKEDRTVPPDKRIDFRLQNPPPLILRARDSISGLDVNGLEIATSTDSKLEAALAPKQREGKGIAVLRGSSPLTIRAEELIDAPWARMFFVKASGYAWASVEFDRRIGGEVSVDLVGSASLDIDLQGTDSADRTVIRLRGKLGAAPIESHVGKRTRVTIDDVPPGHYTVSAEIGHEFENPLTLATAEVDLELAKRSHVVLALKPAPKATRANLSGVLVIPAGWKPERVVLVATLLEAPLDARSSMSRVMLGEPSTTTDGTSYEWRLENAQTGPYELTLRDPLHSVRVDLTPGGTSNVRIEVPSPTHVRVNVIDAVTNAPVVVDRVTWNPKRVAQSRGGPQSLVKRNEATGTYDFLCPLGEMEISTSPPASSGYGHSSTIITTLTGENSATLSLRKLTGLSLRLMDAEKPIKADNSGFFEVTACNGDSKAVGWNWTIGGEVTTVHVTKPGCYRVKLIKPIAGYLMPDEQTVDVQLARMTDVVFQLTKKP